VFRAPGEGLSSSDDADGGPAEPVHPRLLACQKEEWLATLEIRTARNEVSGWRHALPRLAYLALRTHAPNL
jgi:hypothetical protein